MISIKQIVLVLCIFMASLGSYAQEAVPKFTEKIQNQIAILSTAHLKSNIDLADKIYHPNLILTSQSGKKYDKEVALKNIENTFERYENSDFEFLQISDNVVLTNYINERKYKDFPKGKYRLTVVWTPHEDQWKIISMQSSKIKEIE